MQSTVHAHVHTVSGLVFPDICQGKGLLGHTHIVARAVSVKAYGSDQPSPRYSDETAACSGPGRKRSSRCSAEGRPHQAAGRQDNSRRANSQGCHMGGTLRTTATRGWSIDGWTGGLSSLSSLSVAAARSRGRCLLVLGLFLGAVAVHRRDRGAGPVLVVVVVCVVAAAPAARMLPLPPPATSGSTAVVVEEGVADGDEASEGDGLGEALWGSCPPATIAR